MERRQSDGPTFGDRMAAIGAPGTTVAAPAGTTPDDAVSGWAASERRFKVFISYSRGDSAAFAAILVKALEDRGLAAKLDTRDLEFGEKWQAQLKDFIRQADAVVYVVSPRSIASKWCRWELAQVAAQSKRLVPVVHIPVPNDQLPAEIGEVQLFQARPGIDYVSDEPESFAALAGRLAEGLQKDRAWLQEHTRLTDLAYTWAGQERSRDHLLRGGALGNAETWMARRPPGAPAPSRGHLDFISASQVAAKRRGRMWVAGLTAVALGAMALAGLAEVQRQRAIERQKQALINESRAFVALSRQSVESGDATEGALLAMSALPGPEVENDRPFVAEAEQALYAALLERREQMVLDGGSGGQVVSAVTNKTGDRIYAFSEENKLTVWDVASRRAIGGAASSGDRQTDFIRDVIWSGDLQRCLAVGADVESEGEGYLWDLATGTMTATLKHDAGPIKGAAFSADGARLALIHEHSKAWVHDAKDGREIIEIAAPEGELFSAGAISPDGQKLVTASDNVTLRLWDLGTKSQVWSKKLGEYFTINWAFFGPDGRHVFADGGLLEILVLDAETGDQRAALDGHSEEILDADISSDGKLLLTGSRDNTARLWNLEKMEPMLPVLSGHSGDVGKVAFSRDGTRAVTASADATVQVWDTDTGAKSATLRGHRHHVTMAQFAPDGRSVITTGDETVRVWNVLSVMEQQLLEELEGSGSGAFFSPDGSRLVTFSTDHKAKLWDVEKRKPIRLLEKHNGFVVGAAFSLDGDALTTVSWDETAERWHGRSGEYIGQAGKGLKNFDGYTVLGPGAAHLVTADSRSSAAALWDLGTGGKLSDLDAGSGAQLNRHVNLAAFSPNGARVATVASFVASQQADGLSTLRNGTIFYVWDTKTGARSGEVDTGTAPILSLDWDRDNKRVATMAVGGIVQVWDVQSRSPVQKLSMDIEAYSSSGARVRFSPDGLLVVAVVGGQGAIWNVSSGNLVARLDSDVRSIGRMRFTPDSQRLVGQAGDKVQIWDVLSGAIVASVDFPEKSIQGLELSPDGKLMAVADNDGNVQLLPVFASGAELFASARVEVPRCLSQDRLKSLGLDATPPRWCLTGPLHPASTDPAKWQARWPYDRSEWRDWLVKRDRGARVDLPDSRQGR